MRLFKFLFLLTALLLVACSAIEMPQINTYQLQTLPAKNTSAPQTHYTLLVATPTTTDTYRSNDMYYSTGPYEIDAFAKSQWIAPPTQMLLPMIINSINNKRYFKAVVSPPFAGLTDFQLTTQLQQFQQYFTNNTSYFKMTLLASVINNKTDRVIGQRRFDATVEAPQNTPYGGVLAANRATTQLMSQLASWCVAITR